MKNNDFFNFEVICRRDNSGRRKVALFTSTLAAIWFALYLLLLSTILSTISLLAFIKWEVNLLMSLHLTLAV